jgi:hypothetical protein
VGEQAKLLVRLLDLYESKGLFCDGRPAALCDVCPNGTPCWKEAGRGVRRRPRKREESEDGSVCLPWVGRDYSKGGVAVLGINPNMAHNDPTDLLIEHGITWERHVVTLSRNLDRDEGSRFGFGAMRSAAALVDLLDGQRPRHREPAELVDTVARVARLQAVKCVPRNEASRPLRGMWKHCPRLLLEDELDVLRPRFLLVLGADPRWAVEQLSGYRDLRCRATGVRRGRLAYRGWSAEVYAIHHPAHGGEASERALLRSLQVRSRYL